MKVLEEGYLLLAKPRVLHSIPGRMRLHFPLLKRLGTQYLRWADVLCKLLNTPEGIENVSSSHVSGTILLHYDPETLTEKEILSFIFAISRVFIAQKKDLTRLIESDPDAVLNRLREWLKSALTRRLRINTSQRIMLDDLF